MRKESVNLKTIEIIQSETTVRKTKGKNTAQGIQEVQYYIKTNYIHLIGAPREKTKNNEVQEIHEYDNGQEFSQKNPRQQTREQKIPENPNQDKYQSTHTQTNIHGYIIVKLQKNKNKNLKEKKNKHYIQTTKIKIFFRKLYKSKDNTEYNTFQVLKENKKS